MKGLIGIIWRFGTQIFTVVGQPPSVPLGSMFACVIFTMGLHCLRPALRDATSNVDSAGRGPVYGGLLMSKDIFTNVKRHVVLLTRVSRRNRASKGIFTM